MRVKGKKVINLVHHDFEDLELWYPDESDSGIEVGGSRFVCA